MGWYPASVEGRKGIKPTVAPGALNPTCSMGPVPRALLPPRPPHLCTLPSSCLRQRAASSRPHWLMWRTCGGARRRGHARMHDRTHGHARGVQTGVQHQHRQAWPPTRVTTTCPPIGNPLDTNDNTHVVAAHRKRQASLRQQPPGSNKASQVLQARARRLQCIHRVLIDSGSGGGGGRRCACRGCTHDGVGVGADMVVGGGRDTWRTWARVLCRHCRAVAMELQPGK